MINNVTVYDNGAAFMVCVNGTITCGFNTLGGAWNHIAWMYRVASQEFTVGENRTPVKQWLETGIKYGWLDKGAGYTE